MEDLPLAIPAATLIVMRDVPGGAPELLIVERAGTMAFAAGALVFPGGRVDPGDHDVGGDDEGAARVAAIRETLEETGLAVAIEPQPGEDAERRMRLALANGEAFGALLARGGLALRPDILVPFARWLPNFRETRRFDARFYLARAPADARLPEPDRGESVHAAWMTAADAIAMHDRGEASLLFPTRRNLERLAAHGSFDEAVADAARFPPRTITPWVEERDNGPHIVIPDDLGYPVTAEPLARTRRS